MTEPQRNFWLSEARFRLFVGGVGSGKTRAGTIECFRQPPGSTGMVVAPTYTMLRDATLRTFLELSEEAGILTSFKEGTMIAKLAGNRTALFRSADDPNKLRGPNLGWFMLDEAALLDEVVWNIMIGRLRESPSRGWAVTTPRGKNWLYHKFTRSAGYDIIKSSSKDNPYLPEGFVESLEQSYTAEWRAQEIEGDFLDPAGALFRREYFKIVEQAPDGLQWHRYWDLAASVRQTADYTASVAVAMDDSGNVFLKEGIHLRAEWPDVQKIMIRTMLADPMCFHYIEKALHGIAALQELMRVKEIAHVSISDVHVQGDKVQRAMSWAARAEQGKVCIVAGEWMNEFLDEVSMFPHGKHDDYVDSVSGSMPMLGGGGRLLLWD